MRENKGAYKVWELWDIDYYPGLGQIVTIMDAALRNAEGTARKQYEEYVKNQSDD